jgi:hypothetical protein
MFDVVAERDYDSMVEMYAANAQNAIVSYLAMRSRWKSSSSLMDEAKSEEKVDDYLQHEDCYDNSPRIMRRTRSYIEEEAHYQTLLEDITHFLSVKNGEMAADAEPPPPLKQDGGVDNANRLVWESASMLSNSRPPSSFVVYNKDGDVDMATDDAPPIFDGSVANATPPPLGMFGGGGASGGYGTLLHLACAIDSPLALSMLLVLGADARASHTAFRRLMIHEAACNGSMQCLTLLLDLGQECSKILSDNQKKPAASQFASSPQFQSSRSVFSSMGPVSETPSMNTCSMDHTEKGPFQFTGILRTIRDTIKQVRDGKVSELDASRSLAALARLPEVSRISLARSCSFSPLSSFGHFMLSQGWADGHGNTPLHWAAFKNVAPCVSLLLRYSADANARAQPSGWTPLHDAAYSNSFDSVKLLLEAGANVNLQANSGATPLCFAAQEDSAEAVKLLLDSGADLTARCTGSRQDLVAAGPHADDNQHHGRFSGYTPLHYCAHYNAHRAARVLLAHPDAKRAMEIPDFNERLPIHVAVTRASSDVLRELLHAGARIETALRGHPNPPPPRPARSAPVAIPPPPSAPAEPRSPQRGALAVQPASPVSSPILRSLIPARPVNSTKPWNCLSQRSIDECRELISLAEQNWDPARHALFTPADRAAVMELLRVGKRLEQMGTGLFTDLWPQVLSFCGRGWFEVETPEIAPVHQEFGGLPELRLDRDY